MDPLGRARKRLDAKDYPGAVKAFTETMNLSSSHLLLPALEGRARAYVKMKELKLALKDARDMIMKAPEKAKGYLVVGDILKMMKEDEKALLIYEKGLTKVRVGTDENRPKLQESMASLRKQLGKDGNKDRLSTLPLELICMVLGLLDFSDVVRCLSLSKGFKALLEGETKIWKTLDLSTSKRPLPKKSLLQYLKRSDFTLNKAIIKMFTEDPGQTFKTLANTCKQLEYLAVTARYTNASIGNSVVDHLPTATSLKTLVFSRTCSVTFRMLARILKACPTLCIAEFQNVTDACGTEPFSLMSWRSELPCLTHLTLKCITGAGNSSRHMWKYLSLDELIKSTPNLVVGRFEGWNCSNLSSTQRMPRFSDWKKLEVLSLRDTQIDRMPMLPQSLVCLDLSGHVLKKSFSFGDLEDVVYNSQILDEEGLKHPESCNLPNLEEFYIGGSNSVSPPMFEFLTRASIAAGKLRIIDVGGRGFLPAQYPRCDSLVGLSLAGMFLWADNSILMMVLQYPNVRELDLTKTQVTGYALSKMLKEGVPLRKVVLKDCPNVSPDTFDFLEREGIAVVRR